MPLVYGQLRRLAAAKMANEKPGQTLQPTALVHEAWIRLLGPEGSQQRWNSRGHFFGAAAEAMRRILIERARQRRMRERKGLSPPLQNSDQLFVVTAPDDEILAVNDALDQLGVEDPEAADLVKLRYFVGMTVIEASEAMGISQRAAERIWTFAKTWLRQRMDR